MADIINMFDGKPKQSTPNKKNSDNSFEELTLDNVIPTIRAALNGDKKAKKTVLDLLDFIENHRDKIDILDNIMQEDSQFDDLNFPITLPRPDVKEYHVRIKLNHTDLKVWREVKVPSNITLEALAHLLLEVMGWMMEHMFEFRFRDICYCSEEQLEDSMFYAQHEDFSKFTLSDLLTEKGVRMKLEYDFGDSWEHDVWVKGIREYDEGERPCIKFVTGHGECPPEDCGGVWGYAELLELTHKKKLTKEERERLEWYEMDKSSDFDPEYCNIEFFEEIAEEYDDALQNA